MVAATRDGGIGRAGALPWRLSKDMAYFKKLTTETVDKDAVNAVVMGRKTWESIPGKFRPLPGRLNIVLSRSGTLAEANDENNNGAETLPEGVLVRKSIEDALNAISANDKKVEKTFVIGGAQIYEEALKSEKCEAVHLTEVEGEFECDAFIPKIDATKYKLYGQSKPITEKDVRYQFLTYVGTDPESGKFRPKAAELLPPGCSVKHEEYQYLEMIREIIDQGAVKGDRTGTGTRSVFGRQLRFDLTAGFPILTTKRVHFKSVVNELIWFLSGDTNTQWLRENGVSIWDEWATEEGDLGPLYGAQWHAWPTRDGGSINQIDYVVDCLKYRPESRRILFHAWNVEYLPDETVSPQENVRAGRMALPPCHLLYQFYVGRGALSAQLYIRSSDVFLGLPFNIASVALLVHMLAQQCDLTVGEVVVSLGDAHLYSNHGDQVSTQLERTPRALPSLEILRKPDSIYGYRFEDFQLTGYDPAPNIPAPVAI